jgi:O-antigen/teichoic acid export membrane protein
MPQNYSRDSLKPRFLRSVGAMAYGQGVTIATQLASVPVFLHFWGTVTYGEWLVLSALPVYIGMSDIGLASVAANDMTMRVAKGDNAGALEVYQSAWAGISVVSLLVLLATVGVLLGFDLVSRMGVAAMSATAVREVLILLGGATVIALQGSIVFAAFRATGDNALGIFVGNTERLVELFATLAALALGGGMVALAAVLLGVRGLGLVASLAIAHARAPWLKLGIAHARLRAVIELLRPGLAFLSFPLSLSLALQGVVVIVAHFYGAAAVTVFSVYRTLSRLLVQGMGIFTHSAWPEFSAAFGSADLPFAKRIRRRLGQISMAAATAGAIGLLTLGPWFVGVWTHHAVAPHPGLLFALTAVAVVNVLWQTDWILLMAINRHQRFALIYLAMTVAGFLLFAALATVLPLATAVLVLLLPEVGLMIAVRSSVAKVLAGEAWA